MPQPSTQLTFGLPGSISVSPNANGIDLSNATCEEIVEVFRNIKHAEGAILWVFGDLMLEVQRRLQDNNTAENETQSYRMLEEIVKNSDYSVTDLTEAREVCRMIPLDRRRQFSFRMHMEVCLELRRLEEDDEETVEEWLDYVAANAPTYSELRRAIRRSARAEGVKDTPSIPSIKGVTQRFAAVARSFPDDPPAEVRRRLVLDIAPIVSKALAWAHDLDEEEVPWAK